MKKMIVLAIVAVILTTAAYAMVCSDDCSKCQTPCVKQAQAMSACGDKPKCEDPNSKPEAKCGGDKPKCDPNSAPAPTCGGVDPNKPKCGK